MKKKNVVFFMPLIGVGGVEKNLFLVSNFFSKKLDNIFCLHWIKINIKINSTQN